MASTRRKPSRSRSGKLGDAEARESSKACQSWVDRYGQDFRTAQSCGKQLARLKGARGREGYRDVISTCTYYLNDIVENPTAENIVVWMWERLEPLVPGLEELMLWETPEYCVTYRK